MKARAGFVSNSSSSSFCIIGTKDAKEIKKLLEAEGGFRISEQQDDNDGVKLECDGCGLGHGKDTGEKGIVNFHGDYYTVYYAGVDAEKLLEEYTIPEAKKEFVKQMKKKLKVTIPLYTVEFLYGETGEG